MFYSSVIQFWWTNFLEEKKKKRGKSMKKKKERRKEGKEGRRFFFYTRALCTHTHTHTALFCSVQNDGGICVCLVHACLYTLSFFTLPCLMINSSERALILFLWFCVSDLFSQLAVSLGFLMPLNIYSPRWILGQL